MSRLSSFTDSGEFKVEDEKLQDTIIDVINYSVLLYAYMSQKIQKEYTIIELQK
jgi:hypothetical protein